MIRTSVTMQVGLAAISDRVRQQARRITAAAVDTAAEIAQQNASIDLQLQKLPPREDPDGVAAGIRSTKKGKRDAHIAELFDKGTLGKRRKPPKRPGRSSWPVNRGGGYTAHRGDVTAKGIDPEGFFAKAKRAGRRTMLEQLKRGL